MTITKKQKGSSLEIALEGRLDAMTAPELEAELKTALTGVHTLIWDCEKLEYVSSAGLRVLLSAHKAMSDKGGMKLIHVSKVVREVFSVTGFAGILNIK